MDGLSVTRAMSVAAPRRATAPAASSATGPIGTRDTMALSGGAPATSLFGTPTITAPPASAEHLIAEVAIKLKTAQGEDAQRMTAFAAVVAAVANDPQAVAALAQAWRNPNANEGAARLHQLFSEGTSNTMASLYWMAAVDDPEQSEKLLEQFPQAIFSRDMTGAAVLSSLVKEIYNPQMVLQHDKQTCGAATAQILLAREGSAEYVRMVTSLAFEGHASLPNGGVLMREDTWNSAPGDQRTVTSKLLQSALMEFANGADDYNPVDDRTRVPGERGSRQGLSSIEMTRMLSALTNRVTQNDQVKVFDPDAQLWLWKGGVNPQATMDRIERMAGQGWGVPVLLSVRPNQEFGHYQLVTRMDADFVYSINPWGVEQPMPRSLFEQRLISTFFQ